MEGKIISKKCEGCGKRYKLSYYHRKIRKFCSDACCHAYRIGERHPTWIENPNKHAVHEWLKRWKIRPDYCESCGKENCVLDWANVDHKYKRVLDDYICMCRSCHRKYDWNEEKTKKAVQNLVWYNKRIK
jgi:hypothetical protein